MYRTETAAGDQVEISFEGEQPLLNGSPINWSLTEIGNKRYLVSKDHKTFKCELLKLDQASKTIEIKINKNIYTISLKDKMDILLEKMGIDMAVASAVNDLKAPMPGLVLDIPVQVGQEVQKGDQLIILEAMKMENVLKAVGDGVVKSIEVSKGNSVEKNQVLIKF
ncbi:MAG: acetyl-CoA carboxylase biotin carboxyl carrier protein subunit [Cytophagia bacterium]|nr:acetyl-CoA carboxylase biotin carboxyl carrier protein subunit [Cytophagia bacterium]